MIRTAYKYIENYTGTITYDEFISRSVIYTYIELPQNLIGMHINTGTLTEAAINYPSDV